MTDQQTLTEPTPEISSYHQLDYGSHLVDEAGAEALVSMTRRRLLQGLAVAGVGGLGLARYLGLGSTESGPSPLSGAAASTPGAEGPVLSVRETATAVEAAPEMVETVTTLAPAPVDQRILVLIELEGGNDGQSTVVPYGFGSYYDLRGNMAVEASTVHALDTEVGLHPSLGRLAQRQMATVEGVGPVGGVLSHFEMAERWGLGDMSGASGMRAGFLARLADALDAGAAATGLSVDGYTPRFNDAGSSVLSLDRANQLKLLVNDDWIYPAFRRTVRSIGGGPMSSRLTRSWSELVTIGRSMGSTLDASDDDSPMVTEGRGLGRQLQLAAAALQADMGVRVVHARLGGFDTHDGHNYRQERLLAQLDAAVDGFMGLMERAGMADRVLIATSSEFGRRGRPNGSGLDHGAASNMMLFGPVEPGRYGDPSPISNLDNNGNFKTTVPFDQYLATLAQDWLGVEAARVLPDSPSTLGLFQPKPVEAELAGVETTVVGGTIESGDSMDMGSTEMGSSGSDDDSMMADSSSMMTGSSGRPVVVVPGN